MKGGNCLIWAPSPRPHGPNCCPTALSSRLHCGPAIPPLSWQGRPGTKRPLATASDGSLPRGQVAGLGSQSWAGSLPLPCTGLGSSLGNVPTSPLQVPTANNNNSHSKGANGVMAQSQPPTASGYGQVMVVLERGLPRGWA